MIGTIPDGGMPVIKLESSGPETPATNPNSGPHIKPANKTGICIGIRIDPALGIVWNAIGSTTQSAINIDVVTDFFK